MRYSAFLALGKFSFFFLYLAFPKEAAAYKELCQSSLHAVLYVSELSMSHLSTASLNMI